MLLETNPLERKYLYLPYIIRTSKSNGVNIYQKIHSLDKKEILEEIGNIDKKISSTKKEVKKIKFDCIKQMILNNKRIPFLWRNKPSYSTMVHKLLSDTNVLKQFAQNITNSITAKQYNKKLIVERNAPLKPLKKVLSCSNIHQIRTKERQYSSGVRDKNMKKKSNDTLLITGVKFPSIKRSSSTPCINKN